MLPVLSTNSLSTLDPRVTLRETWNNTKHSGLSDTNKDLLEHVEWWHGTFDNMPYSSKVKEALVLAASCKIDETIPEAIFNQLSQQDQEELIKLLQFHGEHGNPRGDISHKISEDLTAYMISEKWNNTKYSGSPDTNKDLLGHVEWWHGSFDNMPYSSEVKEALVLAASCKFNESIPKGIFNKLSQLDKEELVKLLQFHGEHGNPRSDISHKISEDLATYMKQMELRPAGIDNNTGKGCWAICALQLFLHVSSLKQAIMDAPEFSDEKFQLIKDFIQKYCTAQAEGKIKVPNVDIREIHRALAAISDSVQSDLDSDGDVVEGIVALTQQLSSGQSVNNRMQIISTNPATLGEELRVEPEAIIRIFLTHRNTKDFSGLLREFFFPETPEPHRKFADAPREFIINAGRVIADYSSGSRVTDKIHDKVNVPEELVLPGDYFSANRGDKRYTCDFFIEHQGGEKDGDGELKGGHYVSYVKHYGEWLRCDNEKVENISSEEALEAMSKSSLYYFKEI